jgi:hypothetical protein
MLSWDDFDNRTTKIICDSCHKEITDAAKRYLKREGIPQRQRDLWELQSQHTIKLFGKVFVVMNFNKGDSHVWFRNIVKYLRSGFSQVLGAR